MVATVKEPRGCRVQRAFKLRPAETFSHPLSMLFYIAHITVCIAGRPVFFFIWMVLSCTYKRKLDGCALEVGWA